MFQEGTVCGFFFTVARVKMSVIKKKGKKKKKKYQKGKKKKKNTRKHTH